MRFQESNTIELKQIVTDDIKKEIANSEGGVIYVGISDSGKPVGVGDSDLITQQIANMVRDSIKPDITKFIGYETQTADGKDIIVINVQRGTDRPYYLAGKGLSRRCPLRPMGIPANLVRTRAIIGIFQQSLFLHLLL